MKPLGEDTATITWSTNGGTLFCLRTDEKKIPASAVRERVEAIRKQKEADGAEFNKTDERIAKGGDHRGGFRPTCQRPRH